MKARVLRCVRPLIVWLAVCLPASGAHGAMVACGAKNKATGLLRDGATIRVRTECKAGEVVVDLALLDTTPPADCAQDAVPSGGRCVDKYEASAWSIPSSATEVLAKVKAGTVGLADLVSVGAVQVGSTAPPYFLTEIPYTFPEFGQPLAPIYAASIRGILPTTGFSGYQAFYACQLSGKRLLTPGEWLDAMADTPDPDTDDGVADCNTGSPGAPANAPSATGSRPSCLSSDGVFDGLGNVAEIVRDVDSPFGGAQMYIYGSWYWQGVYASFDDIGYAAPDNGGMWDTGFRCVK